MNELTSLVWLLLLLAFVVLMFLYAQARLPQLIEAKIPEKNLTLVRCGWRPRWTGHSRENDDSFMARGVHQAKPKCRRDQAIPRHQSQLFRRNEREAQGYAR